MPQADPSVRTSLKIEMPKSILIDEELALVTAALEQNPKSRRLRLSQATVHLAFETATDDAKAATAAKQALALAQNDQSRANALASLGKPLCGWVITSLPRPVCGRPSISIPNTKTPSSGLLLSSLRRARMMLCRSRANASKG